MRRKTFVGLLVGAACIGLFIFLVITQVAHSGAQCRIVRIYDETVIPGEVRIRIDPQSVVVEGNTCLVWVNLGKAEMKVNFREGKKCLDATEAPSGFSLTEACYVTSWIPFGATSSLTFKEQGTYDYEIEWQAAETKAVGRIVVQ